ncbi:hypothetical protein HELRODRAFT_176731 [Helobdella robusta]|uniref:Histone deacetylase interacting domain-containing protein n=1 Tax=Helobdella robusta TaxID=6412 RepID=T1FAU6_HELRO|nr:hypothetical protein HELRODRAFT_176731 [Helobdella robusta]ESN99563.1 hypothetical protein HELRODRAFT_176731 [Helobdella robusta]
MQNQDKSFSSNLSQPLLQKVYVQTSNAQSSSLNPYNLIRYQGPNALHLVGGTPSSNLHLQPMSSLITTSASIYQPNQMSTWNSSSQNNNSSSTIDQPAILHQPQPQQPPQQQQPQQQQQHINTQLQQKLKVEDALTYLDQVKLKFGHRPQVYNDFLDIMKDFKSQNIDTPGVISRVSILFQGHNELIVGFNTFLPQGYSIEVQNNETINVHQPGQQVVSLSSLGNYTTTAATNNIIGTAGAAANTGTVLPGNDRVSSAGNNGGAGIRGGSVGSTNNHVGGALVGGGHAATVPVTAGGSKGAKTGVGDVSKQQQLMNNNNNSSSSSTNFENMSQASINSFSTSNNVTNNATTNSNNVPSNSQGQPVEFNHAINYVNKIKVTVVYQGRPEIYKKFLDILHNYQEEQKYSKEQVYRQPSNRSPVSEAEVYEQTLKSGPKSQKAKKVGFGPGPGPNSGASLVVSKLFHDQPELLREFRQFLPDANGGNDLMRGVGLTRHQSVKQEMNPQQQQHSMKNNIHSPGRGKMSWSSSSSPSSFMPATKKQKLNQRNVCNNISNNSLANNNSESINNSDYNFFDPELIKYLNKQSIKEPLYREVLRYINLLMKKAINFAEFNKSVDPLVDKLPGLKSYFENYKSYFDGNGDNKSSITKSNKMHQTSSLHHQQQHHHQLQHHHHHHPPSSSSSSSLLVVDFDSNKLMSGGSMSVADRRSCALEGGGGSSKEKIVKFDKHAHIDLSTCKQYGKHYRELPKNYIQETCSGQTELEEEVLNSTYVLFPVSGGDEENDRASNDDDDDDVSCRRNPLEDHVFQCEDERYELDMVMNLNMSVLLGLESLARRMRSMTSDDLGRFQINDLSAAIGISELNIEIALKRVYGDKGLTLIEGLRKSPLVTVPIIIKSLRSKDVEWKESKKSFERFWSEQMDKFYLKSLDFEGQRFKQVDSKYIRSKSLVKELENIIKTSQATKTASSNTAITTNNSNNNNVLSSKKKYDNEDDGEFEVTPAKKRKLSSTKSNDNNSNKANVKNQEKNQPNESNKICNKSNTSHASTSANNNTSNDRGYSHFTDDYMNLSLQDYNVYHDAVSLIISNITRQSGIQSEERDKMKRILSNFLPAVLIADFQYVFMTSSSSFSDAQNVEGDVKVKKEYEEDGSVEFIQRIDAASLDFKKEPPYDEVTSNKTNNLGSVKSVAFKAKSKAQQTAASTPLQHPPSSPALQLNSSSSSSSCSSSQTTIFYCNENWYVLLRLMLLICERLLILKKRSEELSMEEEKNKLLRDVMTLRAVQAKCPESLDPSSFYSTALDMVKNLMSGSLDVGSYEDQLREMFGVNCYHVFTLDKVVQNAVRQLQHASNKDESQLLLEAYESYLQRHVDVDEYRTKCQSLLSEKTCYQFVIVKGESSADVKISILPEAQTVSDLETSLEHHHQQQPQLNEGQDGNLPKQSTTSSLPLQRDGLTWNSVSNNPVDETDAMDVGDYGRNDTVASDDRGSSDQVHYELHLRRSHVFKFPDFLRKFRHRKDIQMNNPPEYVDPKNVDARLAHVVSLLDYAGRDFVRRKEQLNMPDNLDDSNINKSGEYDDNNISDQSAGNEGMADEDNARHPFVNSQVDKSYLMNKFNNASECGNSDSSFSSETGSRLMMELGCTKIFVFKANALSKAQKSHRKTTLRRLKRFNEWLYKWTSKNITEDQMATCNQWFEGSNMSTDLPFLCKQDDGGQTEQRKIKRVVMNSHLLITHKVNDNNLTATSETQLHVINDIRFEGNIDAGDTGDDNSLTPYRPYYKYLLTPKHSKSEEPPVSTSSSSSS